jgi:hypothetical protein
MKKSAILALAACLALGICPVMYAQVLDAKTLTLGNWFISLRPGAQDRLRFFELDAADSSRLYIRRFATPSFYVDAYSGRELKVLLWPEVKRRVLDLAPGASSFVRETTPFKLEYKRVKGSGEAVRGSGSPYEGEWEIGDPPMTVSARACEKRAWTLVMYFPGDPLSAIPMGYYPLFPVGDGTYRSSDDFPDSLIELEYDQASSSLVIRPLFKAMPLAADLSDPVRAWRGK